MIAQHMTESEPGEDLVILENIEKNRPKTPCRGSSPRKHSLPFLLLTNQEIAAPMACGKVICNLIATCGWSVSEMSLQCVHNCILAHHFELRTQTAPSPRARVKRMHARAHAPTPTHPPTHTHTETTHRCCLLARWRRHTRMQIQACIR